MRGPTARNGAYLTKEAREDILPVAEHINDDAASLLLAVIPGWTLHRLPVPLEYPVAKLSSRRENAPQKATVDDPLELQQTRQKQFILHHAIFDANLSGQASECKRGVCIRRGWLLTIDMFAGSQRLAHAFCS